MRDLIDRAFIDLANVTVREEDEEGQGMVEYALIIALVAVLLILALTAFRGNIANVFNTAGNALK